MSWHRRRPKNTTLASIYDAGAYGARHGRTNPYRPGKDRGDGTRAWLWDTGHEDESELIEIEDLI